MIELSLHNGTALALHSGGTLWLHKSSTTNLVVTRVEQPALAIYTITGNQVGLSFGGTIFQNELTARIDFSPLVKASVSRGVHRVSAQVRLAPRVQAKIEFPVQAKE